MAFRERIELLIDITADGARSSLGNLKRDVGEADTAFGKLKAGAVSVFGSVGAAATAGLAAAGAALIGFGTDAVTSFQNVALKTGLMSDKLGIAAEDASKLIEVAGDLGIQTGTLESAINKMNRTAETSPGNFDAIGAAIARNKDGTIDVVQTFKNAAEAIDQIPDAGRRAEAAQQIFGRGWTGIAELIADGAKGIQSAMDSVESGKIIDEGEVNRAKQFRETMDQLKGAFESFAISAGGAIVRVIDGLGEMKSAASTLWDWITLKDARQLIDDNVVKPLTTGSEDIKATYNALGSQAIQTSKDLASLGDTAPAALDEVATAAQGAATGFAGLDPWIDNAIAAEERSAEASKKASDALRDEAKALNDLSSAMKSAADATIAHDEAQEDFAAAAAETNRLLSEGKQDTDDYKQAVDRERDAMRSSADASVRLADEQAKANGATLTGTQRVDSFNSSLLSNASFATPAARGAIADYIIEANRVPAEKATAIRAAIAAGDLPLAKRLLDEASAARVAAINADANTAQANRDLDNAARNRTSTITVRTVTGGGSNAPQALARGGRANAGDIGGEAGAELVETADGRSVIIDEPTILPQNAMVTPLGSVGGTGAIGAGGGGFSAATGAAVVNVYFQVTVNAGLGANGTTIARDFENAAAATVRTNGPAGLRRMLGL